jgi:alkylhydroperoxidase/carboxymuconolactone decarboxylase family protein YurZ
METKATGCCGAVQGTQEIKKEEARKQIIDRNITLLIAAGAAMAANCEPCLNKIVPDLIEAGIDQDDIRRAVEIGQFVKDKSAENMKEVAEVLTGVSLSRKPLSEGCPADSMKQAAGCA